MFMKFYWMLPTLGQNPRCARRVADRTYFSGEQTDAARQHHNDPVRVPVTVMRPVPTVRRVVVVTVPVLHDTLQSPARADGSVKPEGAASRGRRIPFGR
jgi:hypothetical protein